MNLVQVGAQRLPEHLRGAGWITGAGCQHPSGVQKHQAWFVVGRIHSGVQFAGSAVSAISSFPEPHVTALTVQLDPPPSWLLPFLFLIPLQLLQNGSSVPNFPELGVLPSQLCLPWGPSGPLRQAFNA